ncbi:hypothetical protein PR202_ga11311 [Eleusine coracana subsp. coracana]|uniref:DUF4220 domain-containing protein n=1 Tax=Eleusine coracana subsp. coracana TaxID=191504 RepID=A0AAV5C927_ELECO|nr:hypothetical protein QOZ80_5AG0404330 [Eleusine coracana subsp. coracana]GJM94647.1 hypothetical protein PR202_ga11311 [Eleusine coracana subsp. coracana]
MKMRHLDPGSAYCNRIVHSYVYNLTSSYTDQKNESIMAGTSTVMLILASLFFNLNLFSQFSDVSAFLNPSVRLFLKVSLSIFLPVMSYLFSEAKKDVADTGEMDELSLRARTILLWMLLVELLYKKVEAMLCIGGSGGMAGYSGTIERAARIAWLGYLIFFNDLRSAGKKAFYGTLWVLAATKLVQRFVTLEVGKKSFAYGRNPQLLASYMSQILKEEGNNDDGPPEQLLKRCRYAVMGEEQLEKKSTAEGYHFEVKDVTTTGGEADDDKAVVTVGSIWRLADAEKETLLLQKDPKLKRLCLSFALFKLLRRRLEDFPISNDEAKNCHSLIFKGLCGQERPNHDDDEHQDTSRSMNEKEKAMALFQVVNDEVQFLCEYYHSVHPVVFASPFFFLTNYLMFPIVVYTACILTIILCSNGDVIYAFRSLRTDNYPISVGILKMTGCLLSRVAKSPPDLFSAVDVSVTVLLALTFAYEEVWEFLVFLLSNWFMVSLLCTYTSRRTTSARFVSTVIRGILSVRNMLSRPNVCVKQFSVLSLCWLPSSLPTVAVPVEAKVSIMKRLVTARDAAPPALPSFNNELSWTCEGGIAEFILVWHIATALLEAEHPVRKPGANRRAATALSRYCAYLVAFHPELLPGNKDVAEQAYKDMKEDLKKEMGGCWGYFCFRQAARRDKLKKVAEGTMTTKVLGKGARLGKALIDKAKKDDEHDVWKLLAEVWTEVVVCAGPADSEVHVKAHVEALAQGGEFITVLWALATHTGITRAPVPTPHHEHV